MFLSGLIQLPKANAEGKEETHVLRKTFFTFFNCALGSLALVADANAANKKKIGYVWE